MKKLDERISITKKTVGNLGYTSYLEISKIILENQIIIMEKLKELQPKTHNDEVFGPL